MATIFQYKKTKYRSVNEPFLVGAGVPLHYCSIKQVFVFYLQDLYHLSAYLCMYVSNGIRLAQSGASCNLQFTIHRKFCTINSCSFCYWNVVWYQKSYKQVAVCGTIMRHLLFSQFRMTLVFASFQKAPVVGSTCIFYI